MGLDTSQKQPLSNTFGDAVPLGLAADGTGDDPSTIALRADTTMYVFTATSGGLAIATMDETTGSFVDPYLYAYNTQDQLLQANDDSGGTLDSLVQFPVVAGETYYLLAGLRHHDRRLRCAGLHRSREYLRHRRADRPRCAGGGRVAGLIAFTGQVEMFDFTATSDGQVTVVQTAAPGAALGSILTAYALTQGAGGSAQILPIALNDVVATGNDSSTQIVFPVQAGQTYFLAASADLRTTGGYTLTIVTSPLTAPEIPRSTCPPRASRSRGAVTAAGTPDVFQLETQGSGLVSIDIGASGGLVGSVSSPT